MRTKTKILLGLMTALCAAPVGASAAEGKLDQTLIQRVVRAHTPEIRACYEKVLERDPEAEGVVVVEFTIGTAGRVTEATVIGGDIEDDRLHACMRGAVLGWLFPRPDGGEVGVSYPFVLLP
jgi:hypothetical protein